MLTLFAAAALLPAAHFAPADSVKLARAYKEGELQAYSVVAKLDANGSAVDLKTDVLFKVRKSDDKGAEIAMSVRNFSILREGADVGAPSPDELLARFESIGLPRSMTTENESWVYILAAMAGMVPGKEVETGKDFEVKWETTDKTVAVNGTGKLLELVEHEGAKAAKLGYSVEFAPAGQSPGLVKCTTLVSQDGQTPISCEGTVEIGSGEALIKFSVKRLPK
jgi:hypothetical protein